MIPSASIDSTELEPWQPEGVTILDGEPRGRGYVLYEDWGEDGVVVTGIFACEPATTRYRLEQRETIHVLEGQVRIELDSGDAVELGPGDIATLPAGHMSTWTFRTPFKEFFVLSGGPVGVASTP